uniref:FAS1 domain-containing protein n=1 Tax=Pseudo-nitzschia australis TaxID=44445 RepID=A0A7S4EK82_9STRA
MVSWNATYFVASTLPSNGVTGVTANLMLFVPKWEGLEIAPNDAVCFVGSASGLDPDIQSANGGGGGDCTAANGCGVHIHAGMDCESTESQGGHWYNEAPLDFTDPWALIGYEQTNAAGLGQFASCVYTGFDVASDPTLLVGRAFIVHREDGSRASCGLISKAPHGYKPVTYAADTVPIPGTGTGHKTNPTSGRVEVMANVEESVADGVCYMGYTMGLEPDVESFLAGTGGYQCDVPNGCGAHIHSGTGCKNAQVQGGHYYDKAELPVDPWALESYLRTDSFGDAALIGCTLTGSDAADYDARPFIVHKPDGSRLLCGLLEADGDSGDDTPCESKKDCMEGEYCGTKGVCMAHSTCMVQPDCQAPGHDIYYPLCLGTESCSDGKCGKVCDVDGFGEHTEYESCTTGVKTEEMSLHTIACSFCEDNSQYCSMCDLFNKCDTDHLLSTGMYTAFFPTDKAFKESAETISSLSEKEVCNIFSFHFHKGEALRSKDLHCTGLIEMLNGKDSRTKCDDGEKYQKGSGNKKSRKIPKIIDGSGLTGCNGKIITIDQLLLPPH